jgi:8-oxo-dGTP pyrophosphatase MutT (NUDIX family)
VGPQEPAQPREDLSLIRAALPGRPREILDPASFPDLGELRPAAVLVPIVHRDGEARLVFTLRSQALRHGGQISFPGGGMDKTDADLIATAIREADEEIGVEPACVQFLGYLDDVPTPTGFIITPIVAELVPPPAEYRRNQAEVDEIFEVSLTALRAPGVFEDKGEVERGGRRFRICAYNTDGRTIWGATARMVWMLLKLLDSATP